MSQGQEEIPDEVGGDDKSIGVGRDASGNAFVTGNNNQVRVVIYQSVAVRREQQEAKSADLGANPYMGLLAFHEEDSARFFGRTAEIEEVWTKLRNLQQPGTTRLLAVLGPSGSGKSSVARAGLIPELARRPLPGWKHARVAVLTPGSHPLEALAGILARITTGDAVPLEKAEEIERFLKRKNDEGAYDGLRKVSDALPESATTPLIILVDQFEEIYSLCDDKATRVAFIENLLCAARDVNGRTSIIITLRTDFLGETQSHETLNGIICKQQAMIPAMTKAQLREVIAEPAKLAGHPLDEAVIKLLISDTQDRDGALPLLQFALTRIWDGLASGIAPAETFERVGGVGGALAAEAKRIYESLDEKDQRVARRAFLGLVQLGEGTRDTRRRTNLNSLVAVGDSLSHVEGVISRFSGRDARLITLSTSETEGGDTVEVTHEALFTHWQELGKWIEDGRDDLRFQRRLEDAAQHWHKSGRPAGSLWRPPDLDLLREFHRRVEGGVSQLQDEFFRASDDAVSKEVDRNAKQQRDRLLYLRIAAATAAGAVLIACVAFGMFFWARIERDVAEKAVAAGYAHSLGHNENDAPLNLTELNTLWELSKANDRIRHEFVSTSLRGPNDAKHLRRRLELAIQADVGLRSDHRDAIKNMLVRRLQELKTKSPTNTDFDKSVKETCVDVGLTLRITDPEFCALALEWTIDDRASGRWIDNDVVFLADNVTSLEAIRLANKIILTISKEKVDSGEIQPRGRTLLTWPEFPELLGNSSLDMSTDQTRLADAFASSIVEATADSSDAVKVRATSRALASLSKYITPVTLNSLVSTVAKRHVTFSSQEKEYEEYDLRFLAESINDLSNTNIAVSHEAQILVGRMRTSIGKIPVDYMTSKGHPYVRENSRRLDLAAKCLFALRKFMAAEDVEASAMSIAMKSLEMLDHLHRAEDLEYDHDARLNIDYIEGVWRLIIPYCEQGVIIDRLVERLATGNATILFLNIRLLDEVITQSRTKGLADKKLEAIWRGAAESICKKQEVGDSERMTASDIQTEEYMFRFYEEDFEKFLANLRKIATYAQPPFRKRVEELLASDATVVSNPLKTAGEIQQSGFYKLYRFKASIKGASPQQKAELVKAFFNCALVKRSDDFDPIVRREFRPGIIRNTLPLPRLGVELQHELLPESQHTNRFWTLATCFAEVECHLDPRDAAPAARAILDLIEVESQSDIADSDIAGLAKMVMCLANHLSGDEALELAQRIAYQYETIPNENHQLSMLHAFAALSRKLKSPALVELLKWPTCVGNQRTIVLAALRADLKADKEFTSVWDFVDWVRTHDKELYSRLGSPPVLPEFEAMMSLPRFQPSISSAPVLKPQPARGSKDAGVALPAPMPAPAK